MTIAIDTETILIPDLGKVPTECGTPDLACVSFADGAEALVYHVDERPLLEDWLRSILVTDEIIVFHNSSFDIAVLCKAFPEHEPLWIQAVKDRRIRDTVQMFAFRELSAGRTLSLQNAVHKTLGRYIDKGDVRVSFSPDRPLSDEQRKYAIEDAKVTLELYRALEDTPYGGLTELRPYHVQPKAIVPEECGPDLDDGGPNSLDAVYSAASAWQAFTLSATGIGVDMDECARLAKVAQSELDAVRDELLEAGILEWVRDDRNGSQILEPVGMYTRAVGITRRWRWDREKQVYLRSDGTNVLSQPRRTKANQAALRATYETAAEALELDDVPRSKKTGEISLDYKYWNQFRKELPGACGAHMRYQKAQKLMGTYFRPLLEKLESCSTDAYPSVEDEPTRYETCDPQCEPSAPDSTLGASSSTCGAPSKGSGACPEDKAELSGKRLVVFGSYGIGFAETGRWTSWKPNLQNQPKSLRGMYVAPTSGYVIVSADYKSLELYTLCQALESFGLRGKLYETLKAGADAHRVAGALVHGIPEEDVTDNQRQGAKACNFGLPGGMGARRFYNYCRQQYGMDITFAQAAELRRSWFRDFAPEVAQFLAMLDISPSQEFREYGVRYRDWLASVGLDPEGEYSKWDLSRHLNAGRLYDVTISSGRRFPNRRYSQAANVHFQALGAEIVTRAFVKCADAGLDVISVVHDSISLQSPPPCAKLDAKLLAACMLEAQEEVCVDLVDFLPEPEVEIGERWS